MKADEGRPGKAPRPSESILPVRPCDVCGCGMVRGSGGKWLCRACGFMITCCDL